MNADNIATLAVRALVTEACVTPKPGLVDRANNGAHSDMDIFTFLDSAVSLQPYFRDVTSYSMEYPGKPRHLLDALEPIGLRAERDMLRATNGVNTHKGAIFSLGVLCAASGRLMVSGDNLTAKTLSRMCADIASARVRGATSGATNGEAAYARHGIRGIIGEAAAGFPAVFGTALPVLVGHTRHGASLNDAAVSALLHLIATVDDTNVVARRGVDVLYSTKKSVGAKISAFTGTPPYLAYAAELDAQFTAENISPGGCADLLAAALFSYFLIGWHS